MRVYSPRAAAADFSSTFRRAFAEPRDEYLSAAQWMSFDYREGTVAIDRLPSLEAFDSLSKAVKEPAVTPALSGRSNGFIRPTLCAPCWVFLGVLGLFDGDEIERTIETRQAA